MKNLLLYEFHATLARTELANGNFQIALSFKSSSPMADRTVLAELDKHGQAIKLCRAVEEGHDPALPPLYEEALRGICVLAELVRDEASENLEKSVTAALNPQQASTPPRYTH